MASNSADKRLSKGKEVESKGGPRYHVYVRLPFNRGDFVDPPPVDWDEGKSEALWGIISGVAKTEIDWTELAATFGVTVEFLLQMASYLTEHHTSQLRAQMRKAAAAKGSSAPSPVPGAEPPVPEGWSRTASGGGRAPSALSVRRDSPLPKTEAGAVPESPIRPSLVSRPQGSRKSSSNTAIPTQTVAAVKNAATGPGSASPRPQRHRMPPPPISTAGLGGGGGTPTTSRRGPTPEPESPGPADSSSVASSSSSSPVESRIIRRPPRFQPQEGGGPFEDDEEAEAAFLPYQPPSRRGSGQSSQDLVATLRGDSRDGSKRQTKDGGSENPSQQSQTSDSSTSSTAMVPRRGGRKPGPLSPRRTAELAGKGKAKDGSEGNRSMSSSFSDIDDSVTQSALEEALASRMQDGGTMGAMGSRMSMFSHAFRSRVLPRGGGG